MSYLRFGAMVAASTIAMYGLMFLNTYAVEHVRFSETRLYMAILMGAAMTIVMLLFMGRMYANRRLNLAILCAAVAVFFGSLWLVRSQATIGDVAYMKAMIPHHSIAVMTSERARIRDPRVRALADGILKAQVREIGEMNRLIADLEAHPTRRGAPVLPPAEIRAERSTNSPQRPLAKDWAPIGYWAEDQAQCREHPLLVARARIAGPRSDACVLGEQGSAGDVAAWRADCPVLGEVQFRRAPQSRPDRIVVGVPHDENAALLVRCDGPPSNAEDEALLAQSAEIDRQIANRTLVRESVLDADGIFLVRAWKQSGRIVKIMAPIGGGAAAGRDRAFYFHAGSKTPFVIRGPQAVFTLRQGRIAAWYDPDGGLVSTLVPVRPDEREMALMTQASTLVALAEPHITVSALTAE